MMVGTEPRDNTVSFADRLASSQQFKSLFADGMQLVEDVAAYLDGPGRAQSKLLPRPLALAYAAESMRLTTRLMQIASWLLVQKAVNDGEMDDDRGGRGRQRLNAAGQGIASQASMFSQLPEDLQEFTAQSLRIHARIVHLDAQVQEARSQSLRPALPGVQAQFDLLRRAFPGSGSNVA
jgi:regulator of CtrA degradation